MHFHSSESRKLIQSSTLLLLLFLIPTWTSAANILFYFGFSTYSHRITAWPLAVKLAEQGHSVTFLQCVPNKNPHPKVTDMMPKGVANPVPPNLVQMRVEKGQSFVYGGPFILPALGANMCSQILNNTENVEWVNKQKFDLVVIDALYNDCGYGLAWKWKAKTVVFATSHLFDWFPESFGFPDESATSSGLFFSQDLPLGFFSRVLSVVAQLTVYLLKLRGVALLNEPLRENLKMPDMPPVSDLIRNTSLVLMNTHYSEEFPRSLPPLVVPIGGMHVSEKVKPLPKEMEDFIKASGDKGFVYVSFGSEADLAKAPAHIQQIFFDALGKVKMPVLWRWLEKRPEKMPKNVYTSSWMPQQDILGHPKCKGFITHGGLLSMQETVFHAVPMIAFPIFAEQDYNAERLQRTGRGIRLEISTLTQQQLDDAINRLLTDPSLKQQMQLASVRFKDRPEKSVDTAAWWVNYVLRHEDTSFIRPLAINLTWYQRRQLDVWGFLAVCVSIILYAMIKIFSKLLKLCCGQNTKKNASVSQSKKKK